MDLGDGPLPIVEISGFKSGITMLLEKLDNIITSIQTTNFVVSNISLDVSAIRDIARETYDSVGLLVEVSDGISRSLDGLGEYITDAFGDVPPSALTFYECASQTLSQTVNCVDRLNRVNDKLENLEVKVTNAVVVTNDLLHPVLNVFFEA